MNAGLQEFHPLVRNWFADTLGMPTDVQRSAWPAIARGEHLLVTAPTGSGKTLTAFLWAVNQLVSGAWTGGQVRVLYISPLKALNNDIRQNLIRPLTQIREQFEAGGRTAPEIRVLTRSGDTPQKDRRKMSIHPPEILITTPESLNLLLSSVSGCHILTGLKTVILDEIHACAGSKRGVHMMTAVDRLVRLSGDFQR
ncbi:MAG: DEAD/DEAH box helicase, partial [Desulfobacterales bacterium]|nr:DEAD/DEAH box helicase [Desulfobacterales bacterium]